MKATNRTALKEWGVVVKALDAGDLVMLPRKGGIVENQDRFSLEEPEFFLFPTRFHQQVSLLQEPFRPYLREAEGLLPEGDQLRLRNYAVAEAAIEVRDVQKVLQLRDYHIWSAEFIRERFQWNQEAPMTVLLVRTYRLPAEIRVPMRVEYRGCTSWVELDRDLPTDGLVPVLGEEEFRRRADAIRAILS